MNIAVVTEIFKDESGATAIEYSLIAALVAVGAIVGLSAAGESLSTVFNRAAEELKTAVNGGGGGGSA